MDVAPKRPVDLPWGTLAWSRISGSAHSYAIIGELLQTRDGFLTRTFRDDVDKPPAFRPVIVAVDLAAELEHLRSATLPANRDPKRGPVATLEIVAGDRFVRLTFQRPLPTTRNRGDAVDRIYEAIFGWPS